MKKNFLKICIAFIGVILAGCLDDSKYAVDPSGSENVIEFTDISSPAQPFGAVYPVYISAFEISPSDEFAPVISYSGPNKNNENIELTLAVDPLALEEYNEHMEELHGSPYELLPTANYSISSLTVTIPKGETKVSVPVTVYPDKFDLSKKFALPIRVVSASKGVLSAHYSAAIFATVAKNKYDGVYDLNVQTLGWAAYTISEVAQDYPGPLGLATTGPVSNGIVNYWAGSDLLPGFATTGATQFGDASPVFTFDANNKIINVTNAITPFAPRFRSFVINPAATASQNVYDPVTKGIVANFLFKQSGRPDCTVIFKMTYVGPRP